MVERVPGLEAELEVHLLAYRELFPHRQIGRERPRTPHTAQGSGSIAQSVIGRTQESRVNEGGVTREIVVHPIRAVVALGRPHGHSLCCRTAEWTVVRDAGQSGSVQRTCGESGFNDSETRRDRHFSGQVDRITFGSAEYLWHPEGERGHADPDGPPSNSKVIGGAETLYKLPMASITVLRGSIGDQ